MKPFAALAVLALSLVALLQLPRVFFGWEVTLNGFLIPIWASFIACLVAFALALVHWRETRT